MARDGVLVARGVFDHPLFRDKREFSRLEAWVWMLSEAAWKPHQREIGGKVVTLRRGQFCHSIRFMADAWGWSKSSVDRFLTRLKTETMIGTDAGTGSLILTICNYERYQLAPSTTGTATEPSTGTAAGQQRDRLETSNQEIKEDTSLRSVAATPKPTPRMELERVLDSEHAGFVIDHRRLLKKPLTPRAANLLASKLSEASDPNKAADMMIEKGWLSFSLDWARNATQTRPMGTSPRDARRAEMDEYEQNLRREIESAGYGGDQGPADQAEQAVAELHVVSGSYRRLR